MKTHYNYDDLVGLLQTRGMMVSDRKLAMQKMRDIGYYRLSAYSYPFRKPHLGGAPGRLDQFQEGTSFEDVVALYAFDEELRQTILVALQRIEVALASRVGHILGNRHPEAHLDAAHLDVQMCNRTNKKGSKNHDAWKSRFVDLKSGAAEEEYVKHHNEHHDGMPIWVAVGFLDFGATSKLYSMMKRDDRRKVSSGLGFGQSDWDLKDWLVALNILRNHCAHNNRIWNRSTVELPPHLPSGEKALKPLAHLSEIDREKRRKLYTLLAVISHIVDKVAPELKWGPGVLVPVIQQRPVVAGIDALEMMGFPKAWLEKGLWESI